MELPTYTSTLINAPPTYDEATYTESVWPRNYGRSTPRINLAQFYHQVVLNSRQQEININEEMESSDDDDDHHHRDMKSTNNNDNDNDNSNNTSFELKSSNSIPLTYEHPHQHSISELNRILIQSWSTSHTIPSYQSFKQKVKNLDLIPIPNTKYRSS